jgi:uncharacterized protein YidB (DUF937 family)
MSGLDDLIGGLTKQGGSSGGAGMEDLLGGLLGGGSSGGGGGLGDVLGGLLGGGAQGSPGTKSGGVSTGALIAGLAPVVIGMLKSGGLQKMISGFQDKGMADKADSWVSTGDNKPVSGNEMRVALGDEEVHQVAQQAGISEDEAADVLAKVVPEVVNNLTPNGQLPSDDELETLLRQKVEAAPA